MTREMKADRGAGAGHLRWHHRDLHRGGAVHVGGGLDVKGMSDESMNGCG
jgi:hypothetical protein